MKIEEYRLGFVGFGHMARIIFKGLSNARLIARSQILFHRRDPTKAKRDEQECGITATSLQHLVDQSNLLLLCVRPNQGEAVLQDLKKMGMRDQKVISVMAGVTIARMKKHIDPQTEVARVMPNIASEVGEGMSLLSFSPHSSLELRSLSKVLFASLGGCLEIEESQMDIGTAMAGCGPGFVVELIEAMARAGEKQGIEYSKALQMAAQTFLGAAALIRGGKMPQVLLTEIATPGGVTAAGLDQLRKLEMAKQFQSVLFASQAKSEEFSEDLF